VEEIMNRNHGACCAIALGLTLATVASATEGGATIYPAGVETVMPGMMPPPGKTLFEEFDDFYQANGLMNGSGHSLIPGFHLRVAAVAGKFVHNWGVKFLGGTLVSSAAVPFLYEHIDGPFGLHDKSGIGNPDWGVLDVAYKTGNVFWWYGLDVLTPGFQYTKGDLLNIGQHNFATAPVAAFTWLPQHGMTEVSSRFEYFVNYTDPATNYRSGREFLWEYDGMHNVTKKLALGVNGYFYQQVSDDMLNGMDAGNRGRAFMIGPEIRYHMGRVAGILKYQKEMAVENQPRGNAFWCQFGVPLWHHQD
jgi:hypothetical protein